MTDKEMLEYILNEYLHGNVTLDSAIKFILALCKDSKTFNASSFLAGIVISALMVLVYLELIF